MKIHLIYFSPGGTTQKTVRNISKGFISEYGDVEVYEYDMLDRNVRNQQYKFGENDLVILGMMSLVQPFGPVKEIFNAISGNNTPLVGVIMFGNGMYGNSLKVIKRNVSKRGFRLFAAGAFIGQMSYHSGVARGRPDSSDIKIQNAFGKQIANKLNKHGARELKVKFKTDWPLNSTIHSVKTAFMAYLPLGSAIVKSPFNTIKFNSNCIKCGKCEQRCPMGAIDISRQISDSKKCIGCVACVNGCENEGVNYTNKLMIKAANDCIKTFSVRREPKLFL